MKLPRLRSKRLKALFSIITAASLFLLWGYAKIEPKSALGLAKFKISYFFATDKGTFLKSYWQDLITYDGAYISSEANEFLWKKLSEDSPQPEFDAITDFHLNMGSSRRWDENLTRKGDTKERVISRLVERLPNLDLKTKVKAIKWIEEFRREQSFGKGGLYCPDWEQASNLVIEWWSQDLPWESKRLIDPLAGTNRRIDWGP